MKIYLILLIGFLCTITQAQTPPDSLFLEKIFSTIDTRLGTTSSDTAHYFILEEVRTYCGEEYPCLIQIYDTIFTELTRQKYNYVSLTIVEEMVRLARQEKDLEKEALAYDRLSRYYATLDDSEKEIEFRGEALNTYRKLGNTKRVIELTIFNIEGEAWYLGEPEKAIANIEPYLQQAIDSNFLDLATRIRIRLKYIAEVHELYDKLEEQIEALENYPYSDSLSRWEYSLLLHVKTGRGDFAHKDKDYEVARQYFLEALQFNRKMNPNQEYDWLEMYILHRLIKLEKEIGNLPEAKKYLERAQLVAVEMNDYYNMVYNLRYMVEIAKMEKNYRDALLFTEDMAKFQHKMDSISDRSDTQKATLRQERNRLEVEKNAQDLALRLSQNQLLYSVVTAILVALLALGLLVGLYYQRKGTKQLAVQNELIQGQSEQLQQLDADKSRFFANISHELRTPLSLIIGPLKTLLEKKLTPLEKDRLLKMAIQNSQQLQRLVTEILDLQKLEIGKMKLNLESTHLVPFFNQYVSQFESIAFSKQIDFFYQTDLEEGIKALIDRQKCRQIFYNLLSNAFKFTPAKGRIIAKMTWQSSFLSFEVSDTGSGIHPDDLPHLFNRFFQTTRPNKPINGGTGIGLALCNEYMDLLGGKMEVESYEGIGSTIRAIFPVKISEDLVVKSPIVEISPALQPVAISDSSLSNTPKPTILVVEDNPDLREYIKFLLSEKYHVITVENGKEALDFLNSKKGKGTKSTSNCFIPDLVLTDLMMPIMDGYQLLENLKSSDSTRSIPVVMLTARADVKDKLKALRIGVDDYLIKPFEEEELLVRIEALLRNQLNRKNAFDSDKLVGKAISSISQEDQKWLEDFEAFVQKNLSKDLLSIPYLANQFAMSESTLLRKLKSITGLSPVQYLKAIKLEKARHLIENHTYNSVAQVAFEIGYTDVNAFSRAFKGRYGKLPSAYFYE